jgi:hypothetical protein
MTCISYVCEMRIGVGHQYEADEFVQDHPVAVHEPADGTEQQGADERGWG